MEPRGRWNLLRLLFTFDEPIDRGKFWSGHAYLFALLILVSLLLGFIAGPDAGEVLSYFTVAPAYVVGWIALHVKRLWDMDRSGWWTLAIFIPLAGPFFCLWIGTKTGVPPEDSDPRWARESEHRLS